MQNDHPAATCRDLAKTYQTETGEVRALRGVTAVFPRDAVTAVVGPSGSGKSTLLRLLAGIDRPTAGSLVVEGVDVGTASNHRLRALRRRVVAYLFQRPSDNFFPHLTVTDHLRLAARQALPARSFSMRELLEDLGIDHRLGHLPAELSGGEQQRAALAQALVAGARVVVADEPTAELDGQSARGVLRAIRRLVDHGVTFVLATHDREVAAAADAVLELEHGAVRETIGLAEEMLLPGEPDPEQATEAAPGPSGPVLLAAEHIGKSYQRGSEIVRAVRDVSLTLFAGQLVGLVGRSGSGKTTLLNLIAGWERPDAGRIGWRGDSPLSSLPSWSDISVLTQKLGLMDELTLRENVELPVRLAGRLDDLDATVDEILTRYGISELADRYPMQASIGEQQRTALARALVLSPALVLADEPTGHQDRHWSDAVMQELRLAAWQGVACLAATHSQDIALFADRTLAMADGQLLGSVAA